MGPLFGPPDQGVTIHDQRASYCMRGEVCAPLNKVGVSPHRGTGGPGHVWPLANSVTTGLADKRTGARRFVCLVQGGGHPAARGPNRRGEVVTRTSNAGPDARGAGRLDALAQPEKGQDREDDYDEADEVDNAVHTSLLCVGSRRASPPPPRGPSHPGLLSPYTGPHEAAWCHAGAPLRARVFP